MKGKIIPKLLYGVVAIGGFAGVYGLLIQPNFGLALSNLSMWAVSLALVMFGSVKAFGLNVEKAVAIA